MAYLKTSDSIVIQATLTDKGKKLLSRGNFKIAKFALGDDEIDYSLYRAADTSQLTQTFNMDLIRLMLAYYI